MSHARTSSPALLPSGLLKIEKLNVIISRHSFMDISGFRVGHCENSATAPHSFHNLCSHIFMFLTNVFRVTYLTAAGEELLELQ